MPPGHNLTLVGTGTQVCAQEGQKVLEAFLREGVWRPNSCNQGTCGTCRSRVVSGSVDHNTSPLATLSQAERDDGWFLACQASALTDLEIEPGASSMQKGPAHRLLDLEATVVGVKDIARDTRRLLLATPEPLAYSPGQHVELTVPGTDQKRVYSMAGTPATSPQLELHVRRELGGVASDAWVFDRARIGQTVQVRGPLGDFCWEGGEDTEPVVMVAGGTGLAPLLAMLRNALPECGDRQVTLYHSVRTREFLYDVDVLDDLSARHPGFRWVACPREEIPTDGGVLDVVLDEHPTLRGYSGYLCGSPRLIEAGVKAFKRRRMAPRRIFREKYLPAQPGPSLRDATREPSSV